MLSNPEVDICHDKSAVEKVVAQITYETGYFSTVYQPRDGGAGLIHMIPGNWVLNAQDMDIIWPGNDYAGKAATMKEKFFQTAAYGWRSVAAWYKRTNRVIGTCGKDLFTESFDEQTRCIFSGPIDRSEAFRHASQCLAKHPAA